MPRLAESVIINRSPEDVFAFVVDVENEPKWQNGVESSRWEDGDYEKGRQARQEKGEKGGRGPAGEEYIRHDESYYREQAAKVSQGRRARTVSRFLGKKIEMVGEIAAIEPPHLLTWRIVEGPFKMEATWRFEAVEEGTRVTMTAAKAMDNLFAAVSDPMVTRMYSRQLRSDMENLKTVMEDDAERKL